MVTNQEQQHHGTQVQQGASSTPPVSSYSSNSKRAKKPTKRPSVKQQQAMRAKQAAEASRNSASADKKVGSSVSFRNRGAQGGATRVSKVESKGSFKESVQNTGKERARKRSVKHKQTLSERFRSASVKSKVLIICFAVLFLALLIATVVLSWNQWLRYDDHKDFQGTWQVEGTQATFVITDSEMQLTTDVAYSYELDTFNKTITFTFGNLTGSGSYAFSPERDILIISESDANNEGSTVPSKLIKVVNADGSAVESGNSSSASESDKSQSSSEQAGAVDSASLGTDAVDENSGAIDEETQLDSTANSATALE